VNVKSRENAALTDSAAVEIAIRAVLSDDNRVKSHDVNETTFYYVKAALSYGYSEPMTPEQRALNIMLTKIRAGKACCEKAWELYHQLRS